MGNDKEGMREKRKVVSEKAVGRRKGTGVRGIARLDMGWP